MVTKYVKRIRQACIQKIQHGEQRQQVYGEVYTAEHSIFTTQCCALLYCLSQEPDFKNQREWLREIIELRNHKIIFFPKFHCELNYIEMIWAWLKAYLRKNCTYNFDDLQTRIPDALENQITISFIRRVARRCYRYMSGYREGLEGPKLDYAMKKYTSHRRVPLNIGENEEFNISFNEHWKLKLLNKKK